MSAAPTSIQRVTAPAGSSLPQVPPALALRPGETLDTVAARYDLTPAQLEAVLAQPFEQRPKLLVVPEAGETLTLLARKLGHGASALELARENQFDLTKLGGKPWFERAEAISAEARRSTRGRDPDLVFSTDRLALPERVARAWWAKQSAGTEGAASRTAATDGDDRMETVPAGSPAARTSPTSLGLGIAPQPAIRPVQVDGEVTEPSTPPAAAALPEAAAPTLRPAAGSPSDEPADAGDSAADAAAADTATAQPDDGGAFANVLGVLRSIFHNPLFQGAMAVAAAFPGFGQIVSAVGAVLSLVGFVGDWTAQGKPQWQRLGIGLLYGLGVFYPGAGAFGGLAGVLFGSDALPTGAPVAAAAPKRQESASPLPAELETGTADAATQAAAPVVEDEPRAPEAGDPETQRLRRAEEDETAALRDARAAVPE